LSSHGKPPACVLIAISLCLQGVATSRFLCPPKSFTSLAPIRIACPPLLWPFTDYPMFSEPHRRGDSLAWIEAHLEVPARPRKSLGLYEVQVGAADEDWGVAFEREERRLITRLQSVLSSSPRSSRVAFERHRLVLSEHGLVLPQ
jgi:hypothetical protein